MKGLLLQMRTVYLRLDLLSHLKQAENKINLFKVSDTGQQAAQNHNP